MSDYRLQFIRIYTLYLSYNLNLYFLMFIFRLYMNKINFNLQQINQMENDVFHSSLEYVKQVDFHQGGKIQRSQQLSHANIQNLFLNRSIHPASLKADVEIDIQCPCKNMKRPKNKTMKDEMSINIPFQEHILWRVPFQERRNS